jgi:glycosyltransferase involved in cell wall biosynthesis
MPPAPKVRVLHAVKSLGLGGTEKAMQMLAASLDRDRFAPFVHSQQDGPRRAPLIRAGVPVVAGGSLLDAILKIRPDVLHVHRAGWPEPEFLAPLKRARPKAVVETNVFGRFDGSELGRLVDVRLFVSDFCLRRFAAHHGHEADPSRCRVLYNPVDTALFASRTPSIDFTRPAACRLSRADEGKWSDLAYEMLPILKRERPDFRFLVIGATARFERFVREQGLADNVEMLPPTAADEELAAFFGRASLLAHANDTGESFGMCIAEAMAAGLPVITHPALGDRDNAQLELVEHGVTGFVAETAGEYAAAMQKLWGDPALAARMGAAGREKARRLYDVGLIARQLESVYLELLKRP